MAYELTPWRPFRELTTLREEMDKLWNRFSGEWPSLEISNTFRERMGASTITTLSTPQRSIRPMSLNCIGTFKFGLD